MTARVPAAVFAVALLAAGLLGCGSAETGRRPAAVEQRYKEGPNEVVLRLDRDRITAADSVHLEIEAAAPEGVEIRLPSPGEKLGEFTVAAVHPYAPELAGDGRIRQRTVWELEPFLAGSYEIPPLEVGFGGETIRSGALKVEVTSVLPPDEQALDIKEILPPVDMPGIPWWVWGAGAVALAAVGIWYWRRKRGRAASAPRTPEPHEVALAALRDLMKEDLLSRGEAKLFYLRLSAILRHYIEDRFGLHAPERTTEEFLHDLRTFAGLTEEQKRLLKEFLHHCDMVKFAGYRPTREEIDRTLNTCGQFIAETRPRETEPETAGVGG